MASPSSQSALPPRTVLSRRIGGTIDRCRVHTIYCVGKNYADHALEMGAQPDHRTATIFLKPAASIRCGRELEVSLPGWSDQVHHEVELIALVKKRPDPRHPLAAVESLGVGLDLTLRDRQQEAKASGQPWTASKGFPGAAPCSILIPAQGMDPSRLQLELWRGDELLQQGSTSLMLHPLPHLLTHLDERFGLVGGELIFSGTPAGVGPVAPGQSVRARLLGEPGELLCELEVHFG